MPPELQSQGSLAHDIPDDLGLLRAAPLRWRSFVAAFAFQVVLCTLLANVLFFEFIKPDPRQEYELTELYAPTRDTELPPLREHVNAPRPLIDRFEPRFLRPPAPTAAEAPIPERPALQQLLPQAAPKLDLPKNQPAIPKLKEQLHTNVFPGSRAIATTQAPANKVQTGGFGDPNGVPPSHDSVGAVAIAQLGSFDLPIGGGHGNGTAGTRGVTGTVRGAGFENGVAVGNASSSGPHGGTVQQGGFGEVISTARHSMPSVAHVSPALTPAEILSKPQPSYTSEAREKHIEGEVLLDVILGADGHIRILRVVQGLGHGLDESAVRAAQGILFKPAQRDGQPVDSTARIHILFQLA